MLPNPEDLLARARAARWEAERLEDLAAQVVTEASLTKLRVEAVELPPAVEARLHLLSGAGTDPDKAADTRPAAELEQT